LIHQVSHSEFDSVLAIINNAAQAYKGVIPASCWKVPYMSAEELKAEIDNGVEFYGWYDDAKLLAVMGIQPVKDITLIRHAYVRTDCQHRGIGEKLLRHLLNISKTKQVFVGTWTAATWAVRFYQKNGFQLVPLESRSKLRQYWKVSDRHAEASIVLKLEK
jgi:N-acetylglutamate synthase-like GNAT family acetyltransferase